MGYIALCLPGGHRKPTALGAEGLSVLVVEEDVSALDPPHDHVLEQAGEVETSMAWHGRTVTGSGANRKQINNVIVDLPNGEKEDLGCAL